MRNAYADVSTIERKGHRVEDSLRHLNDDGQLVPSAQIPRAIRQQRFRCVTTTGDPIVVISDISAWLELPTTRFGRISLRVRPSSQLGSDSGYGDDITLYLDTGAPAILQSYNILDFNQIPATRSMQPPEIWFDLYSDAVQLRIDFVDWAALETHEGYLDVVAFEWPDSISVDEAEVVS